MVPVTLRPPLWAQNQVSTSKSSQGKLRFQSRFRDGSCSSCSHGFVLCFVLFFCCFFVCLFLISKRGCGLLEQGRGLALAFSKVSLLVNEFVKVHEHGMLCLAPPSFHGLEVPGACQAAL